MHYYKFNIPDWNLGTSHLSLVEEAVYFRLVNFYYDTESPIPLETHSVFRKLRLGNDSVIAEQILIEFFEKNDKGYVHSRCEKDLKDFKKQAKKNKQNGARGGRPKKINGSEGTQQKPTGLPDESQKNPNHKLITNNQEPRTNNKIKPIGSDRLPPVPYQKIVDLYHEKTKLARVAVLNETRKKHIRARWKEELLSSLESWENYLDYVSSCQFLNGVNDRGWVADFDFLIKPDTAIKCQEGKYDERV